MLNERKESRYDSVLYLPVSLADTHTSLGHLVNISDQGLMVIGSRKLEQDDNFSLEIHVPEHFQMSGRVMIGVRLRWCRPDINPDLFAYGLAVIQSSAEFHELARRLRTGYSFSACPL